MAQRSNPALSKPVTGRSLPRLPNWMERERSACHPGQEYLLPTSLHPGRQTSL